MGSYCVCFVHISSNAHGGQSLPDPYFVPRETQVTAPSKHRQTHTTVCFILTQLITQNYPDLLIT